MFMSKSNPKDKSRARAR